MQQTQEYVKPLHNVMYGITHATDGSLILREPKLLKVGIGLPKGKAINVWIGPGGGWNVTVGYDKETRKNYALKTREEAEKFYHEKYQTAPKCKYPRKLPFFTFTRPVMGEDNETVFEPDFDAIEGHGSCPTEIDVVCLRDEPFDNAYQNWSKSELRCKGDGLNAARSVNFAQSTAEKARAEQAVALGERTFLVNECWLGGCKFAGKDCKPGGDLKFQLIGNIRVGGTAYFHTTGKVSSGQIHSALETVKGMTDGRLRGIPLKMCVRPFRTNVDNKPGIQYAVSLELREKTIGALKQKLMDAVFDFRQTAIGAPPVRLIETSQQLAIEAGSEDEDSDVPEVAMASAVSAEFYPEADEEGSEEEPNEAAPATPSEKVEAKTAVKQDDLKEQLRQRKAKKAEAPAPTSPELMKAIPILMAQAAAAPREPTPAERYREEAVAEPLPADPNKEFNW